MKRGPRAGGSALTAVADYVTAANGVVRVKSICAATGYSNKTVLTALARLVRAGFVQRVRRMDWASCAMRAAKLMRRAAEPVPIPPAGSRLELRSRIARDRMVALEEADATWARRAEGHGRFADDDRSRPIVAPRYLAPDPSRTTGGVSRPWE